MSALNWHRRLAQEPDIELWTFTWGCHLPDFVTEHKRPDGTVVWARPPWIVNGKVNGCAFSLGTRLLVNVNGQSESVVYRRTFTEDSPDNLVHDLRVLAGNRY